MRAGIAERYAREWLEQQAMSAASSRSRTRAVGRASGATPLPAGHDEVAARRGEPRVHRARSRSCVDRLRPADRTRVARGVPHRRRGSVRRLRRRPPRRAGALHRAAVRRACSRASGSPAVPDVARAAARDPPARVADVACGAGPVEHRDRPRLPERDGRRDRPRRGRRSRRRTRAPRGERRRGPRARSTAATPRTPSCAGALRPRVDLRGAARHVRPVDVLPRRARAARGRRLAAVIGDERDGEALRARRRRRRAPLLRLQRSSHCLPRRDGRRGSGRHGHGHARGHGPRATRTQAGFARASRSSRSRTTSSASTC